MELTSSDKELLKLIAQLTAQAKGRPPSLAEIAVAAGLQSSSKANIQRQLARLRPIYVDWNASPRSLQVTAEGLAVIELEKTPTTVSVNSSLLASTLPAPDSVLSLLAVGLVKMYAEKISQGKPVQAPYPREWRRGLNILGAECLLRGITPPSYLAQAVEWCKKEVQNWPLKFGNIERFFDEALLDQDEQPTALCHELAEEVDKGNVELEIYEAKMREVLQKAQQFRKQQDYVTFRKYLIEHPVVSLEELTLTALSKDFDAFNSELYDVYERMPYSVIENKQVFLCGFCGWTLERSPVTGKWRCGDDRCRVITANFTHNTQTRQLEERTELWRVNRAIRRYVVAAGKYELASYNTMRQLGVKVELWPGYDSYDLRIEFPNGECWAVDVKDWKHAFLLLKKLKTLASEGALAYTKAFYAVPDERTTEDKNYLSFLRNGTAGQPYEVIRLSDLIEAVSQKITKI
jgi:hypothetical protein